MSRIKCFEIPDIPEERQIEIFKEFVEYMNDIRIHRQKGEVERLLSAIRQHERKHKREYEYER